MNSPSMPMAPAKAPCPKLSNPTFSSSLGFVAAAAGAAIGLGNLWKFPYEVGSHGGALFLLIYAFFVFAFGFPLVLAKSAFGRLQGKGVYASYRQEGRWGLLGVISVAVCLLVASFYNVVTGWILGYVVEMVNGHVMSSEDLPGFFATFTGQVGPNLCYNAIICLTVLAIIKTGVRHGIERSSKLLMPLFLLLLLGLIVYALTLSGAAEGIRFYLVPDMGALSCKTVASALCHAFLSLALGGGVMVTYGAYATRSSDLVRDAAYIVGGDFLVAFLAGLLVLPLIFHQGLQPNQGPALAFIAIPSALQGLGAVQGSVVGIAFFVLLLFAAITSAVSMFEIPTKYVMERWKRSRTESAALVAALSYLMGLPTLLSSGGLDYFTSMISYGGVVYSFMDCIIAFSVNLLMPCACLLFCLFLGQRWERYGMDREIDNGRGYSRWLRWYIYISIRYLAPLLIGAILLSNFFL